LLGDSGFKGSTGNPLSDIFLFDLAEREEHVKLTLRRKMVQALALRARMVLACADGADNKVVAARQRVTFADGVEMARSLRRATSGRVEWNSGRGALTSWPCCARCNGM